MAPRTINPEPASLELSAIYPEAGAITIALRTCRLRAECPDRRQCAGYSAHPLALAAQLCKFKSTDGPSSQHRAR